jgi:HAT1-interacting factor 1
MVLSGSNEAGPSSSKDPKAEEAEEEEEPSNLQLAWEMFELAKNIFIKQLESLKEDSPLRADLESRLSETYQSLGEVSVENEDYKQVSTNLVQPSIRLIKISDIFILVFVFCMIRGFRQCLK